MQHQHAKANKFSEKSKTFEKVTEKWQAAVGPENKKDSNMLKKLELHICDMKGKSEGLKKLAKSMTKKVFISSRVYNSEKKKLAQRWVRKQSVLEGNG